MSYFTYIKKSNYTKHELERRPHRQTADDTAVAPPVFRKTLWIKLEFILNMGVDYLCSRDYILVFYKKLEKYDLKFKVIAMSIDFMLTYIRIKIE